MLRKEENDPNIKSKKRKFIRTEKKTLFFIFISCGETINLFFLLLLLI